MIERSGDLSGSADHAISRSPEHRSRDRAIARCDGSFRDPSGFVFFLDGIAHRQVNTQSADTYTRFIKSGLYDELVRNRLLVAHEEVDLRVPGAPPAHVVLRPEQIPFV